MHERKGRDSRSENNKTEFFGFFWLRFPNQGSNSHSCIGSRVLPWGPPWKFYFLKILFIYFWLHWVFVAGCQLSLVAASKATPWLWCMGFSLWWILLLQSTGSVAVVHGLSCSAVRGIVPDQGSNMSPPHWPADFKPLVHKGSPQGLSRHLEI